MTSSRGVIQGYNGLAVINDELKSWCMPKPRARDTRRTC